MYTAAVRSPIYTRLPLHSWTLLLVSCGFSFSNGKHPQVWTIFFRTDREQTMSKANYYLRVRKYGNISIERSSTSKSRSFRRSGASSMKRSIKKRTKRPQSYPFSCWGTYFMKKNDCVSRKSRPVSAWYPWYAGIEIVDGKRDYRFPSIPRVLSHWFFERACPRYALKRSQAAHSLFLENSVLLLESCQMRSHGDIWKHYQIRMAFYDIKCRNMLVTIANENLFYSFLKIPTLHKQ